MRVRTVVAAASSALLVVAGAGSAPGAAVGTTPVAHHVHSIRTVGPLFLSVLGLGPTLGLPHYCSASVVHSAGHDLAVTAAHCVVGSGRGIEFAPGYSGRTSPYGVWAVQRVYVDRRWLSDRAPRFDVAILQFAPRRGVDLEEATGRAPRLGAAPAEGSNVTVSGYVAGSGGTPIVCTAPVGYTRGFPRFDCGGFAGGVSGGPWISSGRLVGATGGLHQGGCTASTSYSAPFGRAVRALLERAQSGGPGDTAPLPGGDGC